MERYLGAARKISRLFAVGDPKIPDIGEYFSRCLMTASQDVRVDGLPYGTRGGLLVKMDVLLDGQYNFKMEFAGAAREPHQIVDRWSMANGPGSPPSATNRPKPPRGRRPGFRRQENLEVRLPLKAGPHRYRRHLRGAQTKRAMKKPSARAVVDAGRCWRSRRLRLAVLTMPPAPATRPPRRDIFACRPVNAADELPCAKRVLMSLEPLRLSPPRDCCGFARPAAVLHRRLRRARFRPGYSVRS